MNNLHSFDLDKMRQALKNLYLFCTTKIGFFVIFITLFSIGLSGGNSSSSLILLTSGILAFVILYKYDKETRNLKGIITNNNNYQQRQSLVEIHNALLLSLRHPQVYMPVSDYTMKPNNLMILEATFLSKKPNLTLELGSGLSTHLLSSLVKNENKGRVVTFDHDLEWIKLTQLYLKHNGLAELSEIIHVPLVKHDNKNYEWYDYKAHQEKISDIDLLVVDGPPSVFNEMIREGALTYLYDLLNDDAVIFIDDAARKGERQIVANWLKQYPQLKIHKFDTLTGVCIIYVNK
jgi:predicted O-methyltransferase YrrM